jgi:hypothetical protein
VRGATGLDPRRSLPGRARTRPAAGVVPTTRQGEPCLHRRHRPKPNHRPPSRGEPRDRVPRLRLSDAPVTRRAASRCWYALQGLTTTGSDGMGSIAPASTFASRRGPRRLPRDRFPACEPDQCAPLMSFHLNVRDGPHCARHRSPCPRRLRCLASSSSRALARPGSRSTTPDALPASPADPSEGVDQRQAPLSRFRRPFSA